MSNTMPTLVIGDSHGIFLARAMGEVRKGVWDVALDAPLAVVGDQGRQVAAFLLLNPKARVFEQHGETLRVAEPHATAIQPYDTPGALCLVSLHGNDHNGRFMCRHEVPFDFICPHVPDQIALGRQIIPRDAMLRQLRGSGALVADKLRAIQRLLPHANLVFVMPPPPIPEAEHIQGNPEAFDFARQVVEDKWVRLKIHHAYAEVLAATCAQLGVPVLPPPAAALDAEGFLARTHWQGATHAAPSYYRLLLAQHAPTGPRHAPLQATA